MRSIKQLNKKCIDENKNIIVHAGKLCGYGNDPKVYEVR